MTADLYPAAARRLRTNTESAPAPQSVSSILLLAAEPAASQVAKALRAGLGARVDICPCRRTCLAALRREEFDLLLAEQCLVIADPEAIDALYASAGGAPLLEINFGVSSAERVVRQARAALLRRAQDESKARAAAVRSLGNELNASLTGLLLESQLALRQAGPDLRPTLQRLVALANGVCEQLRS